ncbi:cell division protein FtsB [Vogesella urethralis]|jgi:cell division protein FtsB|uniref:cell division protein FtsB n=1 Tax=Vogesella urethralis TaxID=2592656 RepID=UPI00118487FD|nr:cell division protein FtsB [Vogesella urethralis]MEC5206579.1 cell division protein FtsB [Vogesella perlucida]
MRRLTLMLLVLLAALQWPLWLGKGSWLRVWQLDKQVEEQRAANLVLVRRNAALDAEVRDLKQGTAAIEERARNELGMIRQGEVFFQLLDTANAGNNKP